MRYNLDEFFNREEFTSNDLVEFTKEKPSVIQGFVTVMLNSGIFRVTREETKGIIKKRYFAFGSEVKDDMTLLSQSEMESGHSSSEKPDVEWLDEVLK